MKMKWIYLLAAAALIVGLAGCASSPQPFVYHDDRDEKPGPGLFSGEKGGFIIYGEPRRKRRTPKKRRQILIDRRPQRRPTLPVPALPVGIGFYYDAVSSVSESVDRIYHDGPG